MDTAMLVVPKIAARAFADVAVGSLIRVSWGPGVKLGLMAKAKGQAPQMVVIRADGDEHTPFIHPANPDSGMAVLDYGADWFVSVNDESGKPGVPEFMSREFCVVFVGEDIYLRHWTAGGGLTNPFYLNLTTFEILRGGQPFGSEWEAWHFNRWEIRLRNNEPDGKSKVLFNWPIG